MLYKVYPGGNTTVLVEDDEINSDEKRQSLAKSILENDKEVEQVGFLMKSKNKSEQFKLQMAGGEFCGNASRSAAYVWAKNNNRNFFYFSCSGYKGEISGEVFNDIVEIGIGKDFLVGIKEEGRNFIVDLSGIRHVCVFQKYSKKIVDELLNKYKGNFKAVGIIFVSDRKDLLEITPVVWVKDVDSIFNETSCGSGSIAVAAVLNYLKQENKFKILQPSKDILQVEINDEKIKLRGIVKLLDSNQQDRKAAGSLINKTSELSTIEEVAYKQA